MNYLVTGITGFVGAHLAKLLLEKNHNVFGLIRGSNGRQMDLLDVMSADEISSIDWLVGDLQDYTSIESVIGENQFDGVFHLAAQSHPPTSFTRMVMTWETNVMGSVHLIDCIEKHQSHNCRLHFCSSSEVYGNQSCDMTERTPLSPVNPYGASKAAIDLLAQERIANGSINGFITRAFSHTGPRRGHKFSISSDAIQLARMMLGMQDKTLLVGNLQTERVVMDVRDCIRAYYLLMQSDTKKTVFNVCGPDVHKMQVFTDLLIEASGLDGIEQKIHAPFYRPIDIQVQRGDCAILKEVVGWQPEIPLKQTMSDLLEYWVAKLKGGK